MYWRTGAQQLIHIKVWSKAGQRRRAGHCTGPNHELTLVMTKERAEPTPWPSQVYCRIATSFNPSAGTTEQQSGGHAQDRAQASLLVTRKMIGRCAVCSA
jgi:hypothetical protein